MKLSSQKANRAKGIELQMTSMIDVVFLLLIFFIVTSSLKKPEDEETTAIKTNKQARAQPTDFEPAVIQIVEGAGGFVYRVGDRDIQSAEELSRVLGQFPTATKTEGAYVRVSDEAPFSMAAAAIQACKSAKFIAVSYVPLRSAQ